MTENQVIENSADNVSNSQIRELETKTSLSSNNPILCKSYIITKRIAKHGTQSVILIPKYLQDELKPKTIVEVRINIVKEAEEHGGK
jgi:hypothetical protein